MRHVFAFVLSAFVVATLVTAGISRAADEKPAYTIKQVMKAHAPLRTKVLKGEATKEDKEKLLAYYEALPKSKPPKGDEADWQKSTEALVAATKDVVDGKDGAVKAFEKASMCAGCHAAHKPK